MLAITARIDAHSLISRQDRKYCRNAECPHRSSTTLQSCYRCSVAAPALKLLSAHGGRTMCQLSLALVAVLSGCTAEPDAPDLQRTQVTPSEDAGAPVDPLGIAVQTS